jgi:hypothetical protein
MHTRRLITFLLGVWFTLVISIAFISLASLQVAGNTAKSPPGEPARALFVIGEPMTEQLFRYIASEINRTLFETGGLIELILVLVIGITLFLQNYSRSATILAGVLLLGVCASHFLLTPQVVSIGRILDFRPADMMSAERERLTRLNILYSSLTVFRLLCGGAITAILLHRKSRRRSGKIDSIDHAEDSHIDG